MSLLLNFTHSDRKIWSSANDSQNTDKTSQAMLTVDLVLRFRFYRTEKKHFFFIRPTISSSLFINVVKCFSVKGIRRYQRSIQKSLSRKTDKIITKKNETKDKHRTPNTTHIICHIFHVY